MKRRNIIALSLVLLSMIIIIYQLNFTTSARVKKNIDDFSSMEEFASLEVDEEDLNAIYREKRAGESRYSFTILEKKDLVDYKELGKVEIEDKDKKIINSFTLFKGEDKYLIEMRGVYMDIE